MIKGLLKKVFSTTQEASMSTEDLLAPEQSAAKDHGVKLVSIPLSWIENKSFQEIASMIKECFDYALTSEKKLFPKLRLTLHESVLKTEGTSIGQKIHDYLNACEQEIYDFTLFLDKQDVTTRQLYKTYLLPEQADQLNTFLYERCFMLFDTCEELKLDFQNEVKNYFQFLDISMCETFFDDFKQWREQVLAKQDETAAKDGTAAAAMSSGGLFEIKVSKDEVENTSTSQFDHFMGEILTSPAEARKYKGCLQFSFYGFAKNESLLHLMNHKDIKDWASALVEKHPYIFYFLNNEEQPMSKFLTSLVVTTKERENGSVFYDEEELVAFLDFISEALKKLSIWLGEDEQQILDQFEGVFA